MILVAIVPHPIKPNVIPPVLSSPSVAVVRIILGVVAAAAAAAAAAVGIVLLVLLVIPKACVDVVVVVKSNTPTIVEYNRYR